MKEQTRLYKAAKALYDEGYWELAISKLDYHTVEDELRMDALWKELKEALKEQE